MRATIKSLWKDVSSFERFRSREDWLRWMQLRVAASRLGKNRRSNELTTIGFRKPPSDLALRTGTSDFLVLREIFILGEYDSIKSLQLPANPTVLDLGANIGAFVRLAESFWPDARFLAVEPDASNFELLERNVAPLSARQRIDLVRGCVGSTTGRTTLDRSQGEWGIRMNDLGAEGDVPVEDVETLISRFGVERIALMKCDIEGAEREVFANCSSWIHRVDNLVIEIHGDYTIDRLSADLRAAGSNLRCLNPHSQRPTYVFAACSN